MADITVLHEVTSMPHENIDAFSGLIKLLITANPVIGSVAIAVGGLTTFFLKRNTAVTKNNTNATVINTQVNELVTQQFEAHSKLITESQNKLLAAVAKFTDSVDDARAELIGESDKYKIAVMKLSKASDDKLSHITSVSGAIEHHLQKLDEKFDVAMNAAKEADAKGSQAIDVLRQMAEKKK